MIQSLRFIGVNNGMIDLWQNELFHLVDVDGLTSVTADVASSTTPSMDGDIINMIQAQPRGIVLTLRFKQGVSVEMAKRYVLAVVKPKHKGTLRMVDEGRETEIVGVVTGVTMPRFTNAVMMQITMHCSAPFWEDVNDIIVKLSRIRDMHYFPVPEMGLAFPVEGVAFGVYDVNMTQTYTNEGDVECGMVITIIAVADVTNPTIYRSDGAFIGINDTLVAGDEIVIDTNKGRKSIKKNGVSIFSKVRAGSDFFQLEVGNNEITIDSEDGTENNMYFTLSFKRRFV